ncbi:unnamed protein product [Linum trigynum]|uniref:Uncharacterized protein n=1 Tax=Linum trigynum TaxID=586398 RepID=A0AAV2GRM8_9ROSI
MQNRTGSQPKIRHWSVGQPPNDERKLSAVVGLAVGEGRSTSRRDERGSGRRVNSDEGGLISSAMTKSKDNKRFWKRAES